MLEMGKENLRNKTKPNEKWHQRLLCEMLDLITAAVRLCGSVTVLKDSADVS
jgi:hypothetical protein